MKLCGKTAGEGGTLFDNKRNKQILEELKVEPDDQKLRRYEYKSKWLRNITRMNSSRMPEIVLNCRPIGRRRIGKTLKGLLHEVDTGLSRPN